MQNMLFYYVLRQWLHIAKGTYTVVKQKSENIKVKCSHTYVDPVMIIVITSNVIVALPGIP